MKKNAVVNELRFALLEGNERETDICFTKIFISIEKEDKKFGASEIKEVNELLRSYRQDNYMIAFGELLTSENRNTFETDKHYAQALIDTKTPIKALPLLRSMVKDSEHRGHSEDSSEAYGLIGRAHKDLFLFSSTGNKNLATRHLSKAFNAYDTPWKRSPENNVWHGVNLLALHSNAVVNGFPTPSNINASEIADEVIEIINKIPEDNRNYWDLASLAEAHVEKKEWNLASTALVNAVDIGKATPFELNGTLRQFKEIWRLQDQGENSANLVTWLERTLIGQPNSEIILDASDIDRQQAVDEKQLEALQSHHKMRTGAWMKKYMQCAESVASVIDINTGEPKGTCSIIDGEVFSDNLKGRLVCLTNDHVLSNFLDEYSTNHRPLAPADAAVRFTQSDTKDKKFEISKIIWSSSFRNHDVCLFEVRDGPPVNESTIRVVSHVPRVDHKSPQEIFIISHPYKEEISFSFQNTNLIDHDANAQGKESLVPGLIHYTTPTVQGSSGGIALNAALELVGIHHAGGSEINRLNGHKGTYAANEAIWIQPIINAVRNNLEKGIDRWVG